MKEKYILAIDQGTTASTALIIDHNGQVISKASREISRAFPQPGWVEQDAQELYRSALVVANEAIENGEITPGDINSMGITNQRETTIVWDRHTGKPVGNAIVWQCRRTAKLCEELKRQGLERLIQEKTGLIIDAYFSATKIRWLLDSIPEGQKQAENGDLLFGTVDTWLVWNLTEGAVHVTDYSNASRTMLYNIHTLEWDKELLKVLNIPECMLPRVVQSSEILGETKESLFRNNRIPIGAIAGDQQAALFGQACYESGSAKNTYGTGSFVLLNTGTNPVRSKQGLVTTLAWGLNNEVTYAMEGSIFITGAAVQWLRDGLGIISTAAETETMALSVKDTGGVHFVPAFAGMGAPFWDMYARGLISGLTQGTTREHLVRATLEAIAYQSKDVIDAMSMEAGLSIPVLKVDGGGSVNKFTMQFQSDILGIPIHVSAIAETTALGAGYLAGLASGFWKDITDISRKWRSSVTYEPTMTDSQRDELYAEWRMAIERTKSWAEG